MGFDLGDVDASGNGPEGLAATGTARRLSPLPVFVAGAALVASTVLMFVGKAWPLPLLGWILTPFVVVGCLGWARVLVLKGSSDPWFDRAHAQTSVRLLQVLTFVAFVASVPHIWRIGQEAALWMQ